MKKSEKNYDNIGDWKKIDFGEFPKAMRNKLGKRVLAAADKREVGASYELKDDGRLVVGCFEAEEPIVREVVAAVIDRAKKRGEL